MTDTSNHGCGGGHCACAQAEPQALPASINGIALHTPGEALAIEELRERA